MEPELFLLEMVESEECNKTMLDPFDIMVGFARIIHDNTSDCDILYRLDERLAMPAAEYYDYTGVAFEKFYGPQFRFDGSNLFSCDTWYKLMIVSLGTKYQKLLNEILS